MNLCKSCIYKCDDIRTATICKYYIQNLSGDYQGVSIRQAKIYVDKRSDLEEVKDG